MKEPNKFTARQRYDFGYGVACGSIIKATIKAMRGQKLSAIDFKLLALDGKWITTEGDEDEGGGGLRLYINPSNGKVLKGPKTMVGKTMKEGFKDLKQEPKTTNQPAKSLPNSSAAEPNNQQEQPKKKLTPEQVAAIVYKKNGAYKPSSIKPEKAGVSVEPSANFSPYQSETECLASFAEGFSDTFNSLTKGEYKSLRSYTGYSYRKINSSLRNYKPGDELSPVIKGVTNALNKASLPENTILYRGGEINELNAYLGKDVSSLNDAELQKLVGHEFVVKQFTSSSISKGSAFGGVMHMTIKAPKGTKGLYLDYLPNHAAITQVPGEKELLLQRGLTYSVSKISRVNGKIHIEVEVLDKKPTLVEKLE